MYSMLDKGRLCRGHSVLPMTLRNSNVAVARAGGLGYRSRLPKAIR
jgi:hypothetical protein